MQDYVIHEKRDMSYSLCDARCAPSDRTMYNVILSISMYL